MVTDEVRVGLGSGRIPLTVSVGDGDAPARGCLCPILTGNLAAFNCQKSSVPICLRQHATSSGGSIRTERIGKDYFCEGWKGLARANPFLHIAEVGASRFQQGRANICIITNIKMDSQAREVSSSI